MAKNRYQSLLEKVFFDRYQQGDVEICFKRDDLIDSAKALGMALPKNLGDVIYSVRYRTAMPDSITATHSDEREWIIEGRGRALYAFILTSVNRILPNLQLMAVKIPDATPEIISAYTLSDEQALLAVIRYNRLIDIFLGVTCYSLQNHLRTTVTTIGQVEIDEVYVGVDRSGRQYVIPVQAKGGSDQLSIVQARQDIDCCAEKFPNLICRAISTQFLEDDLIAVFEVDLEDGILKVVEERHYRLVPRSEISDDELRRYSQR